MVVSDSIKFKSGSQFDLHKNIKSDHIFNHVDMERDSELLFLFSTSILDFKNVSFYQFPLVQKKIEPGTKFTLIIYYIY